MKKSLKIVIGVIVLIALVGLSAWYVDDKKETDTQLSQEEEQELRTAVFGVLESIIPDEWVLPENREQKIQEIIAITGTHESSAAANGKWLGRGQSQYSNDFIFTWSDWIAWKEDQNNEWTVIPRQGELFRCEDLDKIPPHFTEFFRDIIYDFSGDRRCEYLQW